MLDLLRSPYSICSHSMLTTLPVAPSNSIHISRRLEATRIIAMPSRIFHMEIIKAAAMKYTAKHTGPRRKKQISTSTIRPQRPLNLRVNLNNKRLSWIKASTAFSRNWRRRLDEQVISERYAEQLNKDENSRFTRYFGFLHSRICIGRVFRKWLREYDTTRHFKGLSQTLVESHARTKELPQIQSP